MSATVPVWQALIDALPPYKAKLERRVLTALAADFAQWYVTRQGLTIGEEDNRLRPVWRRRWHLIRRASVAPPVTDLALSDFLAETIATDSRLIEDIRLRQNRFLAKFTQASGEEERGQLLIDHARALGASPVEILGDKAALQRWFGVDALTDRMQAKVAHLERRIAVTLLLFGLQAKHLLQKTGETTWQETWQRLRVEAIARSLFTFEGHPQVKMAAFCSLSDAVTSLPYAARETAVAASTVQFIYRCALDTRQFIWLQVEAIKLLRDLAPVSFFDIVRLRLTRCVPGDDLFVRRRALLLAGETMRTRQEARELLPLALEDSSPYVRQGLCLALATAPTDIVGLCLHRLLKDTVAQVRAQALLTLAEQLTLAQPLPLLQWLAETLENEPDSFVLRTALRVVETWLALQPQNHASDQERLRQAVLVLHESATDLKVRRWAAETLGYFALQADSELAQLVTELGAVVSTCPPGQARRLPRRFDAVSAETLGLAARFLVRADYPLDFERRFGHWRVQRGHRFGFRLWRWLHEFRHPSPDKRQAFRHTIGRIFYGHIRVPSPILAELAETKVPGEPLHLAAEAGWRPYLPLPDELLSSLDLPRSRHPLRIFSAEGVTSVAPPASLVRRLLLRARLCWRFVEYAQARNWQENSQLPSEHYVQMLRADGFTILFQPHAETRADPSVSRFFAFGLPVGLQGDDFWHRFQTYFFSVYGNTLFELTMLICSALVAFIGRHLLANVRIHRARQDIPLVVGGWGTRGKSGTERLKAGLFNGMGYSVVSKTTGCEAMFLHSHPYQTLREMFLFRPYDKATIWEQHNVTRIASELKADVLLWECMALTPAFVELLQKRWMRDDLSTITNTFPDHEDLQGPAGINIPQVMTHFIPRRSTLLTSEEQMRPILATAATELGTRMIGVGWLESGLLAPDILARFPYQEHPDNIALVVRMAAELGIEADFALKEMADRVVPDLGVLKVYPEALVADRRLSFANGMSANERFGCLGNWFRLGFDQIDAVAQSDTLVSTVVNNRADRIARSRVFASILVNDISADLHFLIGSNLEGLRGYIREAWVAHVAELSLWPEGDTTPMAVFEAQAQRLRVPYSAQRLRLRLAAMLKPAGLDTEASLLDLVNNPEALSKALQERKVSRSDEIVHFVKQATLAVAEFAQFASRLANAGSHPDKSLDAAFREQLWVWFERKLITVADYYASGNQIIQLIAEHTPPGFHNRIMGIQNIKGTGLDFVYRWQAWALCHAACTELRASDAARFRQGLAALGSFQEYGVLCEHYVRATLSLARNSPHGQLAIVQAQFAQIEANLDLAMGTVREQLNASRVQGRMERIVAILEGFLDAGDAIKRRRLANRIYRDLIAQRISHSRAAMELLKLTQRQKGGWLYGQLRDRVGVLTQTVGNTSVYPKFLARLGGYKKA